MLEGEMGIGILEKVKTLKSFRRWLMTTALHTIAVLVFQLTCIKQFAMVIICSYSAR